MKKYLLIGLKLTFYSTLVCFSVGLFCQSYDFILRVLCLPIFLYAYAAVIRIVCKDISEDKDKKPPNTQ